MKLEGKKGSAATRILGIALGTFAFLILFKSISVTATLLAVLTALIFLTLGNIWSQVSSRSKPRTSTPKIYASSPVTPSAAHAFTNLPSQEPPRQSLPEYKISEIAPSRVIEEFSTNLVPKIPEVRIPSVRAEKPASKAEIEKEIEDVLSKYRRSNLYQDYIGQVDSTKSLFESEEEEEAKPASRLKKPEAKAKAPAKAKAKEEKKEEPKKNTWVNVSEDKKGKVRFKEEEVESTDDAEDDNDDDDPDKEAEEYILRLNKKARDGPFEEADEDDEDQKDEEDLFF